jgi:predicted amidohydrolase YtcJ
MELLRVHAGRCVFGPTREEDAMKRRDFLKSGALAGAAAASGGGALTAGVVSASERGDRHRKHGSLVLVNGRIHTMDERNRVVSSVEIRDGRFAQVGGVRGGDDAEVIDLRGRTVVPGLIESHTHFVSLANRPGYHVVLERARNIAEVQELLAARRAAQPAVPEGQFITAMGGWSPNQWAERRLPTQAELDAAVPDRPVFLYQGGTGPVRVNSLGQTFFQSVSNPTVSVVDGVITGAQANNALYHLRIRQSFEDKKRSALDSQAYSAAVGVTALLDQTLVAVATGTLDPASLDPQPNHFLFNLNHYRMYDGWLALHGEGKSLVRLQMNFLHNQGFIEALGPMDKQLPELRERLKNQFRFFGDDMLRTGGIGEWAAPFAAAGSGNNYEVWLLAQRLCAQARWRNENAQSSEAGVGQVVETYEMMEREFGIQELRWGLQHGDFATPDQLRRLKELNCGLSTSGFRWTATKPPASGIAGPLFPQIFDSGINIGLHQDGVHIAPHNPWFALHYATTGLNVFGVQINAGQQISRQQALHAYTRGNAWYLNREHDLGSIEKGKFADLVVLDKDYFRVSDAEMREIRPILTVVGGNVVHDSGALGRRPDHDHHDHDRAGRGRE